jgi:hypothetical protein
MKGLLVKDIQIVLKQKKLFIIWFAVTLIFLFANEDPVFGISYSLFLMVITLVGTISYDDFDNGMGFLMTLPISRKTYALEKYVLVLGGSFLAGAVTLLVSVCYLLVHPEVMSLDELVMTFFLLYSVIVIFAAVYIPFQLKYGAEKGRLVLLVAAAVIFGAVFMVRRIKVASEMAVSLVSVLDGMAPVTMLGIVVVIAAAAVLISAKISIGILQKEEY